MADRAQTQDAGNSQRSIVVVTQGSRPPPFFRLSNMEGPIPSLHGVSELGIPSDELFLHRERRHGVLPFVGVGAQWAFDRTTGFEMRPFDLIMRTHDIFDGMQTEDTNSTEESTHYKEELNESSEFVDEDHVSWEQVLGKLDGNDVPAEFVCPITLDLMQRPFVAQDGFSYERSAIVKWLASVKPEYKSPKTNLRMGNTIIENKNLKLSITEWLQQNGIVPAKTQAAEDKS
tara:strand:- start:10628 stop:11320 length:693 start_codon:yes stop_codon:yes gene_type:complete